MGQWKVSSISKVFPNQIERTRFLENEYSRAFQAEQRQLDAFIFGDQTAKHPSLLTDPELKTASGRLNRSKVMAYLYQHAETEAMTLLRAELTRLGATLLASIHDAVTVRERLTTDQRRQT